MVASACLGDVRDPSKTKAALPGPVGRLAPRWSASRLGGAVPCGSGLPGLSRGGRAGGLCLVIFGLMLTMPSSAVGQVHVPEPASQEKLDGLCSFLESVEVHSILPEPWRGIFAWLQANKAGICFYSGDEFPTSQSGNTFCHEGKLFIGLFPDLLCVFDGTAPDATAVEDAIGTLLHEALHGLVYDVCAYVPNDLDREICDEIEELLIRGIEAWFLWDVLVVSPTLELSSGLAFKSRVLEDSNDATDLLGRVCSHVGNVSPIAEPGRYALLVGLKGFAAAAAGLFGLIEGAMGC